MSATETAANLLRAAAAKIDQSMLRDDVLTKLAKRKIIRAIDEHGEGGVVSMKMMPSWTEGSSPMEFVSGYRMIFDATAARVVPSIINTQSLYAGTMAFQIPKTLLENSQLSEEGVSVHPSSIVKALQANVEVSGAGLSDSYTGLFEHKNRGETNYTHDYWVVSRNVNPQLNAKLAAKIEEHAGDSYAKMMRASAPLRVEAYNAQREERANKISAVLESVGISMDAADILHGEKYVDNVFNTIVDGPGKNQAALHSDAVLLDSHTLANGLVLTENMRLGPMLLRGGNNSTANSVVNVLPSTTGLAMPLYAAMQTEGALVYDTKSKMSTTNACTWVTASSEYHPLLAKNAYRSRSSAAWKNLEQRAGFSPAHTISLTPIAVKLAHPGDL